MLIESVNFSRFCDAFVRHDRNNAFSYKGKRALFDYFEELENNVELDIVSICCTYTENDWEEIANDYNVDLSEWESDEEKIAAVREYLEENTTVLSEPFEGNFLFETF